MIRFASRTLIKGLVVVLPVAAAVYVLLWFFRSTESGLKWLILKVMPESYYVPGIGLALVIVGLFCVGLLMYSWITQKLFSGFDRLVRKIPIFGHVYGPVRDLMDLVDGNMQQRLGQVVMVRVPNTDMYTLGFITRNTVDDLPEGFRSFGNDGDDDEADRVVVFVQWASQIGGYCFIVPRSSIRPVDMTVEQGVRWSLTAGISAPTKQNKDVNE